MSTQQPSLLPLKPATPWLDPSAPPPPTPSKHRADTAAPTRPASSHLSALWTPPRGCPPSPPLQCTTHPTRPHPALHPPCRISLSEGRQGDCNPSRSRSRAAGAQRCRNLWVCLANQPPTTCGQRCKCGPARARQRLAPWSRGRRRRLKRAARTHAHAAGAACVRMLWQGGRLREWTLILSGVQAAKAGPCVVVGVAWGMHACVCVCQRSAGCCRQQLAVGELAVTKFESPSRMTCLHGGHQRSRAEAGWGGCCCSRPRLSNHLWLAPHKPTAHATQPPTLNTHTHAPHTRFKPASPRLCGSFPRLGQILLCRVWRQQTRAPQQRGQPCLVEEGGAAAASSARMSYA